MVKLENIKRICVVGAGTMGSGIALAGLLAGFEEVVITDLNKTILENSRKSIREVLDNWDPINKYKTGLSQNPEFSDNIIDEIFEDTERLGILSKGVSKKTIINRLILESELQKAVQDADFIIEAATENLPVKQEIFKQLGTFSPSQTILATNSSTMSITSIGAHSERLDKVVGLHFHNYYPLLARMIEITPSSETSKETMDTAYNLAKKLPCALKDKFVVKLEKESPGLIANRFSMVTGLYTDWIFDQAYEKGITTDQLITVGVISPAIDLIGIDVAYGCTKYFQEHVSSDFSPGKKLTKLYNEGRFGKKVGKGYFDWDENGPVIKQVPIDAETGKILGSIMESFDMEIFGAIGLNEGCRLLEEGVLKSYKLIDQTLKSATFIDGPFLTGVDKYKEWTKKLEELAEKTRKSYLKPCDMMKSGKFLDYP